MRVFEAIPELLRRQGTTHVFSMLGGTNVTWIAEGVRSDVFRLVSTRHEETCVHAATGYARATGHLGVCSTTRGPGFANAVNGLISATASHVPLLLIVGESPTPITRTSYTEQQVEQEGFAGLIGAGFTSVSRADELEGAF